MLINVNFIGTSLGNYVVIHEDFIFYIFVIQVLVRFFIGFSISVICCGVLEVLFRSDLLLIFYFQGNSVVGFDYYCCVIAKKVNNFFINFIIYFVNSYKDYCQVVQVVSLINVINMDVRYFVNNEAHYSHRSIVHFLVQGNLFIVVCYSVNYDVS